MPTAMYSIYATVGLHVTVPRMPVLQLYESLSGTQFPITTGANWDTPGLTGTVPVSPARIVPVSPGLTSHEKYDLACDHDTASSI